MLRTKLRQIIKEELENVINKNPNSKVQLKKHDNLFKDALIKWIKVMKLNGYTKEDLVKKTIKMINHCFNKLETKSVKTESKDDVKEKYPSVIDYSYKKVGNKIEWNLISSKKLNRSNINTIQYLAGYPPQGYGEAFQLKEKSNADGTFEYTWKCYSSSD